MHLYLNNYNDCKIHFKLVNMEWGGNMHVDKYLIPRSGIDRDCFLILFRSIIS